MARRKIKLVGEKANAHSYSAETVNVSTYIKHQIDAYKLVRAVAPDKFSRNLIDAFIIDLEFIKAYK